MSAPESDSAKPPATRAALPLPRNLINALAALLTIGGIGWAVGLYSRIGLQIYDQQFLAAMLGLCLVVSFLKFPLIGAAENKTTLPWYDALAAAASLLVCGYIAFDYVALLDLVFLRSPHAVIVGALMIGLLIEALRRATGIILPILVVVFIVYALFANQIGFGLAGRSSDFAKLSIYLSTDPNGVLGTPMLIAVSIVIAFVLFGNVLTQTGGMAFFTDLAISLMGSFRGGAAKIAILGSCLFGSISGSAVANVVATGVVTIPLMKRTGYPAHKAGAIEAVASTGGQLMPPVMGAAAFLMAEFLQTSYATVVSAAIIPGLLYYIALFIQADLEAAKQNIPPIDRDQIPPTGRVMRDGWYFPIAFVVLIVALFHWNLQPETSVMYAVLAVAVPAVIFGFRGARPGLGRAWRALVETGHGVLDLLLIVGAAGIVIGVLAVTGLGFNLTVVLVNVGQGNLPLLLFLSAIVCIVLGMGLPTVGVYVLLATLVAPSLIKIGVEPIAAHLYVMYFGMMSMITPPVAIAAFAAASVAGADPMRTGFTATRFGWTAFIVPVLFVFSPTLLMIGNPLSIILAFVTAVIGVGLISIGAVGYSMRTIGLPSRLGYILFGLMALTPADRFGGAVIDAIGIAGGIALLAIDHLAARRVRQGALSSGDSGA